MQKKKALLRFEHLPKPLEVKMQSSLTTLVKMVKLVILVILVILVELVSW